MIKRIFKKEIFIAALFPAFIFTFYFLVPWLTNHTIYLYRWDEATYYHIHNQILATGYIPDTLNYVGGIKNYIYPLIYLLLNNLLIFTPDSSNLQVFSVVFQLILFVSLTISTFMVYLISLLTTKDRRSALYSALLFLILPVISYRLFYSHATYYANFLGISFILLFIYYLLKYREGKNKVEFILSVFFYSVTLFTHQLVFMMATVILFIDFAYHFRFNISALIKSAAYLSLYGFFVLTINLGYIIKTPMLQKILSLLGISHYEQFGTEMVTKTSSSNLPTLIPALFIVLGLLSQIFIYKRYKSITIFFIFFCFISVSLLLHKVNIFLPASFRYDTFYLIPLPFMLSVFVNSYLKNRFLKAVFISVIFVFFSINVVNIKNGFTKEELYSVKTGLNELGCSNTVSYFRLAPWIPVLSESDVYYAHVDIYNAHQDRMEDSMRMFSDSESLPTRLEMMRTKDVDCLVYEKNIFSQDGIRVKGWEPWRYETLYQLNPRTYEDSNVVVFKIVNNTLSQQ